LYIFLSASLVTLLHRRAGRRGGWGRETYPNVYYLHTYTHTLHSRSGSFCICSCVYVLFAFGPVSTFVLGYIDNPKYCFGVDGSSIAGQIAFIL
jgi:hypothetical protein